MFVVKANDVQERDEVNNEKKKKRYHGIMKRTVRIYVQKNTNYVTELYQKTENVSAKVKNEKKNK